MLCTVPTPTVQEVMIQPAMPERISQPEKAPTRVSPTQPTMPARVSPTQPTMPARVSPTQPTMPARVSPTQPTMPARVSPTQPTMPARVSPTQPTMPARVSPTQPTMPARVSPTQPTMLARVSPTQPTMPARVSPPADASHHPAFSRRDSEIMWQEEQRERERQAQEIAMLYPHSPPDHFKHDGGLPPLIEEEVVVAQTNDVLESLPPPLPTLTKTSPSPQLDEAPPQVVYCLILFCFLGCLVGNG